MDLEVALVPVNCFVFPSNNPNRRSASSFSILEGKRLSSELLSGLI